jgi:hypothetical protein
VPAESEQARLVALHERLEGSLIPAASEGYESLVTLQSEQRRAATQRRNDGMLL